MANDRFMDWLKTLAIALVIDAVGVFLYKQFGDTVHFGFDGAVAWFAAWFFHEWRG